MERFSRFVTLSGGVLCKQGTVRVYIAGTSTPATIYSDNQGTSLSNPFAINNITGEVEFFAANGLYDVVITTPYGEPLLFPYVSLYDPSSVRVVASGLNVDFVDYRLATDASKGWHGWWDTDGIHFETIAGSGADIFFHPDGGTVHLNTSLDVSGNGEIHASGRINSNYDPNDGVPALWLSSNLTPSTHKDYIFVNPFAGTVFDHFLHFVKTDNTDAVVIDKNGNTDIAGYLTVNATGLDGGDSIFHSPTSFQTAGADNTVYIENILSGTGRSLASGVQIWMYAESGTVLDELRGIWLSGNDSDGNIKNVTALYVEGQYSGTVENIALHITDGGRQGAYAIKVDGGLVDLGPNQPYAKNGANTDITSLKLGNGTYSVPSLSFSSDASYGFWKNTDYVAVSTAGLDRMLWKNTEIRIGRDLALGWSSSVGPSGAPLDLLLYRDAANTLAQRNGTNAQTFNLYGTYTDASNYERLSTTFDGGFNYVIDVQKAGTGSSRNLAFKTQGQWGMAITSGTGNITFYRNLGFITDNAYDIGTSGANRPRNVYAAGAVIAPNLSNIVAAVSLTGKTASIGTTTIYIPANAGTYRVSTYMWTQVGGTSGTVDQTISFNNGASVKSNNATGMSLTAFSNITQVYVLHCAAGQPIQYWTTVNGATGSPQYGFDIVVEQLA